MFEQPTKEDLARSLSLLTQDTRNKLMTERNQITSEAIKAGAVRSSRVIVTVANAANTLHETAMKQAASTLLDFIERKPLSPVEITKLARPHLENLGDTLLGVIRPHGFQAEYDRIRAQYHTIFQQRLDGVLRDIEIGLLRGADFTRAVEMENQEEWIRAAAAVRLLEPVFESKYSAKMFICKRAHGGLVRARAERYMIDEEATGDNHEIPKEFWWAEGNTALTQDWTAGDFAT